MKKQKNQYSDQIHHAAPEMLLDAAIGLRAILSKFRDNDPKIVYYKKLLATLEFGYMFALETQYIHERNIMLEAQVSFMANQINLLENKLREFSMMRKIIADDRLEEILENNSDHLHLMLSYSLKEKLAAKNNANGTN